MNKLYRRWNTITALAVLIAFTVQFPVSLLHAGSAVEFNWDDGGTEGFAAFQLQWSNVGNTWGGELASVFHSARMVGLTGLGDPDAQAWFAEFLACQEDIGQRQEGRRAIEEQSHHWNCADSQQGNGIVVLHGGFNSHVQQVNI